MGRGDPNAFLTKAEQYLASAEENLVVRLMIDLSNTTPYGRLASLSSVVIGTAMTPSSALRTIPSDAVFSDNPIMSHTTSGRTIHRGRR